MTRTSADLDHLVQALRMPPLVCGSVAYTPARAAPAPRDPSLPKVSIVTVCYNSGPDIARAIRSVAEQSYDGPLEYIVIDGGSTDGHTLHAIEQHLEHVDCLLSEPDDGIYDAMNKGLLRATGDYVALLNADDRLFPDFVAESVRALQDSAADISFCNYVTEDTSVHVSPPNSGIYLSQLGIKHNTFLMHRRCFERVGGFDARLKVVADAKWNRAAFASGLEFVQVSGVHVFYSTRGLSAGSTSRGREVIIAESSGLIAEMFPQIDESQARMLYLANFNTHSADRIIALCDRFAGTTPLLSEAIGHAMRWNLRYRPGYTLKPRYPERFAETLNLARRFDIDPADLPLGDPGNDTVQAVARFLAKLRQAARQRARGKAVHLHYAQVYSRPSETFIHDFLCDLDAAHDDQCHVMLCDTHLQTEGRDHELTLCVPWPDLPVAVANRLYAMLWDQLDPRRIIAHFALNGWRLFDRLIPDQRARDWVNMCHGIDVFVIGDNPGYTGFIRDYCALAPHVAFTAVSDFLAGQLEAAGVPKARIFKVPNAVPDSLTQAPKTDGFWDGTRPLRLLNVGRLIGWKGHALALDAMAALDRARPDVTTTLTIVYGRMDDGLDDLSARAQSLGLGDRVTFVPFVDFRAQPGYMAGFDLFVLPSTLSEDPVPRTETFGIAMIEAIAAGLPVIGTDAGGIPEVVGAPHAQARIVPHGDAGALADALADMIDAAAVVFASTGAFAERTVARFTAARRLSHFAALDDWFAAPRRRIVHFCALGRGGAAGAAINIHKGLLRRGYDSVFVTRATERSRLPPRLPGVRLVEPDCSVDFNHLEPDRRPGFTTFTLDDHALSNEALRVLVEGADLVNLAWSAKFLSVRNIAWLTRLGIPVTLTLRDMQHITGGCHFFHGCDHWQGDCSDCPQSPVAPETQYPHLTQIAKRTAWNFDAITFIALSDHSLDTLSRARVSAGAARLKLPNYVDVETFHPDPAPFGPVLDDLPDGALRIGYLPSYDSRIKGHRAFCQALRKVRALEPDLEIVVLLAANAPLPDGDVPYPVVQVGAIEDRDRLRRFYNTADLVAVPSLEETFSNTTLEALACGVPVVGFRTGVLSELLDGGPMGTAVEIGDTGALAHAIVARHGRVPDRAAIATEIAGRFGWESRIAAYEDTFHRLMDGPAPDCPPISQDGQAALAALDRAQVKLKRDFVLKRLRDMRNRTDALQRGLARSETERNAEIARILASRSFRVTEPLRRLSDLGQRLRSALPKVRG